MLCVPTALLARPTACGEAAADDAAAAAAVDPAESLPAADSGSEADQDDLSGRIDALLQSAWREAGLEPAGPVSDEAFVRRVFLDLAGRIPTVAEREAFLADPRPDRREVLIDRLLASDDHARHLADLFDVLLMGRGSRKRLNERREHGWQQWLEASFKANRPWNEMADAILRARPQEPSDEPAVWFLYERENDHQKIAEAVAPAFFGFRIECAQCHDSMTAAEIEQAHYWGLVAFFNRSTNTTTDRGPRIAESAIGGFSEFADIEGTSSPNLLTFFEAGVIEEERPAPDATQEDADVLYTAATREGEPRVPVFSRRERFVDDVLRDHPLVARAMANRLWAILMGRGIVHPFDEMDSAHEASHPTLLELLAADFRDHGYDIRRTLRAIAGSAAYQASSMRPEGADDPASFAWYLERPLTAEQFTRSLQLVLTGSVDLDAPLAHDIRKAMPDVLPDESVTGIAETLFLSNGPALQAMIREAAEGPQGLAAAALLPTAAEAVDAIFLAALGRLPGAEEAHRMVAFLQGDRPESASSAESGIDRGRLAMAAWAIVTSAEFRFNH